MTDADSGLVRERRGHVLVLRLDRPEARNALTIALLADLNDALASAERDTDTRAVVLTGTGDRAFCAGMDLRSFSDDSVSAERKAEVIAGFQRLMAGQVAIPLVGAANATAVGGGLELLLGCDLVVASSAAEFGLPEVSRGLFPGGNGTTIATRIPLALALELALTGDRIDAGRALELGLVNAVVEPADVVDTAISYAERIARNAPLSVAAVKELVRLAVDDPIRHAERLGELQKAVFQSEDAKEGAQAFAEKRDPCGAVADVRAAVCHEHGPPDVVVVEEVDVPTVGPGQARVRVGTAAVNFPDVLLIAGTYQISVPTPFVPGSEFAGVVEEVADDVASLAVGDRVMGTALVGAFAEQAVAGADVLRRIPDGVDLRAAAAFGVAHRTAYHVLRSVARVQAGEQLVVLGAGGGVGLAAVQLGHHLGATVTAVASSPEKLEVAAACGATHLIDHRAVELRPALREAVPDGADVVVDPVGGDLAEPALRSLHYGGRFVTVGYASGDIPRIPLNLVLLKGIAIVGFQFIDFATRATDEFERNERELMDLLDSHAVVPHVGATFALDDVAAAMQLVADGGAVGKVVLEIASA